ncbi:MAG: cyanophycinase [Flavobacteriales bacterium]|nr:cyanophycinase [Flavobacteriales bacterium]
MNKVKGTLIPVGGNEDKGLDLSESQTYSKDFISEGILWHILNEAKGVDSKVVIIPTASGIPKEVARNYLDGFGTLGCTDLTVLDIQARDEANDEFSCELIHAADCIMMSGGDQLKLSRIVSGTKVHEIMMDRYKNDKIVIAGTSAGAVAMSEEMVIGGSSKEALIKGAVLMDKGLAFIPELIIDSHFIRRGRFGRLAEAVARKTDLLGIGLAEDTGIIIKNGDHATVIGSGMVILFDPEKLTHNKNDELEEGTPMSMSNLIVHILSNGDEFSIKEREIHVLPLDKSFI